jgi:hypothetical protein
MVRPTALSAISRAASADISSQEACRRGSGGVRSRPSHERLPPDQRELAQLRRHCCHDALALGAGIVPSHLVVGGPVVAHPVGRHDERAVAGHVVGEPSALGGVNQIGCR